MLTSFKGDGAFSTDGLFVVLPCGTIAPMSNVNWFKLCAK